MAVQKRNLIIVAVVILVIAIVLSSFVYLNYQHSINEKQNVSLSIFPNELTTPIFVAQDQHFFDENGINLTITILYEHYRGVKICFKP